MRWGFQGTHTLSEKYRKTCCGRGSWLNSLDTFRAYLLTFPNQRPVSVSFQKARLVTGQTSAHTVLLKIVHVSFGHEVGFSV